MFLEANIPGGESYGNSMCEIVMGMRNATGNATGNVTGKWMGKGNGEVK